MKVDLIRKYKWYIVAIMAIVMMLSVSLTFCLWDDNSLQSIKASGGSGDYAEKSLKAYKLVTDVNGNNTADVGDIVTFGKYYQETNETNKTPLRWIVVDSIGGTLTLLTEKVVAFGSFWDDEYYLNSSNAWVGEDHYNQRYNTSTIKEWLNSELRNDKGKGFDSTDSTDSKKVFNGFYREAFDPAEQSAITARTIGSMKGYYGDESNKNGTSESPTNYGDLPNQKVWIPSWTEIYGTTSSPWGTVNDYSGDKQFSYFSKVSGYGSDSNKVANSTPYAANSNISNYTNINATGSSNSQGGSTTSGIWWWLRSPMPGTDYYRGALRVHTVGQGSYNFTCYSNGGVRPAVCLPL